MFTYVLRANLSQRIALALFGSLLFGLLNFVPVMAQETEATETGTTTEVSSEAEAAVESDLVQSADAAKESDVDIKEELDIAADYDPVVPNTFVNSIGYGFKKFGRGIKGASYRAFASTESYVELSKRYADLNLVEAIKLQSIDPTNSKVVGILNDYKSNLDDVKDRMEGLKETNGQFAKEFSAKVAEDHLFTAPKILNSLQQNLLSTNPSAIPEFLKAKSGALANAGETVIKAASNSDEAVQTLKTAAEKNFKTPFSGIGAADNLTQAKEQLVDVPDEFKQVFDKAISSTLNTFHDNFKSLDIPDESKAEALQKYVEQLPGQS
ncbi:MAG: hypothetical protein Q8R08_04700, partial [bacterium]|nr:hypothetical protein [bacterium]